MVFAPAFFLVYSLLSTKHRKLLIGAGSLFFYSYWNVYYLPLLLISAFIDYFCSLRMHLNPSIPVRRFWLLSALALNLGILFFFKYWNFFSENVAATSGFELAMIDVILPLGISFYTLQTLSYTFDTYRGKLTPEKNFGTYLLYVSFFPQLVAGPIERASNLLPQLKNLPSPTLDDVRQGTILIAWGFFAKLVVADNISGFIWSSYHDTDGGLLTWPISFFAAAQVYCDFFGYTLMARGLARYMGIKLSMNFRQPFFAKNLTSFWQRWHISLTKWVMDYIHLPLAKRFPQEPARSILAILAMCLIGLWHGASWNFVLFGLVNGLIMRVWSPVAGLFRGVPAPGYRAETVSRTCLIMSVSLVSVFFFIRDTDLLFRQLGSMVSTNPGFDILSQAGHKENFAIGAVFLAVFLLNDALVTFGSRFQMEEIHRYPVLRKLVFAAILLLIALFGNFQSKGFIYFEF